MFSSFSYFYSLYRKEVFVFFILLAVGSIMESVGIILLVPILQLASDTGIGDSDLSNNILWLFDSIGFEFNLLSGLVFFFCFYLLQTIIICFRNWYIAKRLACIKTMFRDRLYNAFMQAKLTYVYDKRHGSFVEMIFTQCEKAGTIFHVMNLVVVSFVTIFVLLGLSLYIDWESTIFLALSLWLVSVMLKEMSNKGHKLGSRKNKANDFYKNLLINDLGSIKQIKVLGSGDSHANRAHADAGEIDSCDSDQLIHHAKMVFAGEIVVVTLMIVLVYISLGILKNDFASVMVVVYIFMRLKPHILSAYQNYFHFLTFLPALDLVREITLEAENNVESNLRQGLSFDQLKRDVMLKNIQFAYMGRENILQGIDLVINKGDTIAFVGRSGGGKTTIADLLMGLYEPTYGDILVDGVSLSSINKKDWRSRIGYVTQDPVLIHDSIRKNIEWGLERKLTDEEIVFASRMALAHGFIEKMPGGYEAIVGDRGVKLSGGQRQRIALARALARKPEILILDEATSSIDSISEKEVQKAIDSLPSTMTIIIIAHRLSTIRKVDTIFLLEKGKIVEQGTWDQLVGKEGPFNEMLAIQLSH